MIGFTYMMQIGTKKEVLRKNAERFLLKDVYCMSRKIFWDGVVTLYIAQRVV